MLSLVKLTGKGVRARFVRFSNLDTEPKELIYEVVGTDFQFPIPLDETKGAVFLAEDKASIFRRWIRLRRAELLADKPITPTVSSRGIGAVSEVPNSDCCDAVVRPMGDGRSGGLECAKCGGSVSSPVRGMTVPNVIHDDANFAHAHPPVKSDGGPIYGGTGRVDTTRYK